MKLVCYLILVQSLKQNGDHSTTAEKNGWLPKTNLEAAFFCVYQRPDPRSVRKVEETNL